MKHIHGTGSNTHISYLRTLWNLEWTDFLVFNHKVEFGYSFSGQMTPDQLNNQYVAKCISCKNTWSLAVHDGQVVKNHSLKRITNHADAQFYK